ncbi:TM2 domain-containing protein [Echinicola marina]|uniref:TM2 domain-containing protein n=1 Tax=Echinicola marina TaxID=2859768 RepID=UPI001CF685A1|nr:TM2 domain-containing protein [Echinicola marina]UCS92492.1 TM2 domain-containing protein [Echinicola marina]
MMKHYLMSKFKSTGVTYLLWLFFGCHYAYLGMWGIQLLYWLAIIAGFLFFPLSITWTWCVVDLFLIPGKVNRYNAAISAKITEIEKSERDLEFQRNLTIAQAKYQTNVTDNNNDT